MNYRLSTTAIYASAAGLKGFKDNNKTLSRLVETRASKCLLKFIVNAMENSVLIVIIKYNEKVNGNVHNKSYQLIVKVPGSYPDCDRNSIFLSSYTDFIQSIVMGYLTVVPKRYF